MSATGLPQRPPGQDNVIVPNGNESEPLLGRPGDAAQPRRGSIFWNLIIGTAAITQFGAILLFIMIWVAVFTKPVTLFSGHPLLQATGVLVLIQSILSVQPTHTADQKRIGQRVHASLNLLALLCLIGGVTIIEYNKIVNHNDHFHSVHGYLGVITSISLALQYLVGFTMWAVPSLYGGVDNAKSLYKYHRWSGYIILVLLLVTVITATQTEFNLNVLGLKLWATILLSILILTGTLPRIQKQKLGI
ncbi:eukaryotic cytochrome b561-domain-containing protein [Emericellopsis atlantica]|uniref:Eukaryotic cytochrome b561-domain-containing protein n=1 Tax=Emericellopsis atlantica TaxID=2614577 RepID=A0A9P8CXD7_9HYPO|nr:eukaryotic cytochrome b561-domain-containing protein [Emericellopsis atlantica]KAG9258976.1 eukaryotic cytochrome b561-domain-containing protein [Emericellopsis atlantica]